MASSGKKKTTMAKLNRESKMRERRLDKQARKDARKLASAESAGAPDETLTDETLTDETLTDVTDEPAGAQARRPALETVPADA